MQWLLFFALSVIGIKAGRETNKYAWNTAGQILPWESYLQLSNVNRPFGLELNRSSIVHHHFAIGHLCLHSFMYDVAQDAFNMALSLEPTFIEAHIGKIFGCKHPLWGETDFNCGLTAYNAAILATANVSYSPLQSALLATAYLWYSNTSSVTSGEQAFLSSVANLTRKYPNETDIRVWYSLSLLNVAQETAFESEIEPEPMLKAREILKEAFISEPQHPGILHYLIHAYDVARVEIAEKGREYAILYGEMVETSSHAQHMASHIWMRTGSWLLALKTDSTAIRVSLALCATRITNSVQHVNSTQLETVLSGMNDSNQTSSLLGCDAINRAHSSEWLAYTRMQVGDVSGSQALISDLFIAHNRSLVIVSQYLPYAYIARARMLVDHLYWLSYSELFVRVARQLYTLDEWQPIVMLGNDSTGWYPSWSEAAYRLGDSLRILAAINASNYSTANELSKVDDHLHRLKTLSSQTTSSSQFVSISISLMISQIRAIQYFVNGSYEACLIELKNATQREMTLVPDNNSPYLIFIRSSELLAFHLLLIYKEKRNSKNQHYGWATKSRYDTMLSIGEYPAMALSHYQNASYLAPNRTINTLGLARSNEQLEKYTEAARFYRLLLDRMLSAYVTDNVIIQEAKSFFDKYSSILNTATKSKSSTYFSFILLSFSFIILHY